MLYVIVSLFFTVFLGYLSLSNRFVGFRSNKQDFYQLLISLIASFVGIFMAINLESFESDRQEIDQVVGLLQVAKNGAEGEAASADTLMKLLDTMESDEASRNDQYNHYNDNPVYLPSFFESIITNDLVMTKITPETYEALTTSFNTIKKTIDSYNDKNKSFDERYNNLEITYKEFVYSFGVLDSEIQYLNKKITKDDLEDQLGYYNYKKIGVSEEELQNKINDALSGSE